MSAINYNQPPVDALPYVDTIIDDDDLIRALAMKEVDDELEIFPPDKDYLQHLPPLDYRPFLTPLLKAEQSKLEQQEPREDFSRLAHLPVDKPPETNTSENDSILLEKCLNQVKIKLEYQQRQLLNLDILKAFNSEVWSLYMKHYESMDLSLKKELDDINKQTQQINWSRKETQEQVGKTLELLNNEWNLLVDKNRILNAEIRRINKRDS